MAEGKVKESLHLGTRGKKKNPIFLKKESSSEKSRISEKSENRIILLGEPLTDEWRKESAILFFEDVKGRER